MEMEMLTSKNQKEKAIQTDNGVKIGTATWGFFLLSSTFNPTRSSMPLFIFSYLSAYAVVHNIIYIYIYIFYCR